MRQKRNKRVRRAVQFYKVAHGFKEPYKVLLDGNFLHACELLKLGDAPAAVAKLLGAPTRCFVTRCVQAELRELGPDCGAAAAAAARLPGLSGGPAPPATAAESILAAVGSSNSDHFFVGTQDAGLRAKLAATPGVPLLFVSAAGLGLEVPTVEQKAAAGRRGRGGGGAGGAGGLAQADAAAAGGEAAGEAAGGAAAGARRRSSALPEHEAKQLGDKYVPAAGAEGVHTTVRFRRNAAKGPNPLAVRKKKRKAGDDDAGGVVIGGEEEGKGRQREKPARKRRRGAAAAAAAAARGGGADAAAA